MVLVTGATGFIGSHLCKLLLKKNYTIRALFRSAHSPFLTDAENSQIEWIQADVNDVYSLLPSLHQMDAVFHCAATVSFDRRDHKKMMLTNVEGTANMVNAMLDCGVKRLIHLSSVAALGRTSQHEHIDEDADWISGGYNSQYAVSKYRSEMEVWRGAAEGLQVTIVNPGIVLGEGDWNIGSNKLFKNIYNEFPFYTSGITSFVDVKDVVKAMLLLYENKIYNERFIISAGNYTYKQVFDWMANGFQKQAPRYEAKPWMINLVWRFYELKKWFSAKEQTITKETARSAVAQYDYANDKLKSYLPGFEYTELQQTIQRCCAYYMDNN